MSTLLVVLRKKVEVFSYKFIHTKFLKKCISVFLHLSLNTFSFIKYKKHHLYL